MKPHKENPSTPQFQIGDVVILQSEYTIKNPLQMTIEYIFDEDTVDVVYKNGVTGKLHRDRLPRKTVILYTSDTEKEE